MVVGIPKIERIWVKRTTSKGEIYYITSKENRDFYFLYKEENGKAVKNWESQITVGTRK